MVNETEPLAESAAQMAIIRSQKITLPSIKINDLSALNKRLNFRGNSQRKNGFFSKFNEKKKKEGLT